jgi:hypothetical protein
MNKWKSCQQYKKPYILQIKEFVKKRNKHYKIYRHFKNSTMGLGFNVAPLKDKDNKLYRIKNNETFLLYLHKCEKMKFFLKEKYNYLEIELK